MTNASAAEPSPQPAPRQCFVDPIGVAFIASLSSDRVWIRHREPAKARHVAIYLHDPRCERTLRIAGTIMAGARTEDGWMMSRVVLAQDQFDVREMLALLDL